MSRPGLTYHDVAAAAQQLSAQGKNPTIESVRFLTGTGSSTTIAQHLKEWKARQDQTKLFPAKEKLPEEIVLSMKVLWDRVMTQAEEKLIIATQDFEQSTTELKENYNKQREESIHWHQQYNEMKQEKDQLAHEKLALEQAVRQLEDEKIALIVTQDSMSKQLQENKDRINELHRLNKQVQANLEHYYEASREQRMLDKQSYEQAQVQLEQTTQQLKQELIMLRKEKTLLGNELAREKLERNTLQTQHDQLVSQSDIIKSDLNQFQKEVIKHAHAEQHWQTQYQQTQKKLDEQQTLIVSFTTEIAVLSQKHSDAQGMLKEMGDQNKFLAHEKWILAQENAQLVGQLKQFEKLGI